MKQLGSINSFNGAANHVSHPETVDIHLVADDNGTFGFTLQGSNSIENTNESNYPIIGYVEPNSSAEKSGLMQPGDRIILVNNNSLEGLTLGLFLNI